MRGIVISPPSKMEGESFTLINSSIDPLKLRQYMLFWDKVDFPNNNILRIGDSPEISFLREAGVLQRTEINFKSFKGNIGHAVGLMQSLALMINNNNERDSWSFAQPNTEVILPKDSTDSEYTRCIEVELYDCIPVPGEDVNLEDILNFKEKRNDELIKFRHLIDEFYLSIINSGDIPRSKINTIEKLQNSLVDLNKVMSESKIRRYLSSVKVELNVSEAIKNSLISGAVGHFAFNLPAKYSALLGLATSSIKISTNLLPKIKNIPDNLVDYAYLYYAEKELK